MQTVSLTILSLGFILGLKHALDADHLIAVATIVSERKRLWSSSIVGALWGVGHTFSLLLVGILVVALKLEIPERMALAMELGVAAMLVLLGLNVLWKVFKGEIVHVHVHEHHGHKHIHPHIHAFSTEHEHSREQSHREQSHREVSHREVSHHERLEPSMSRRLLSQVSQNTRSILVGMVHGLAGSAALMLIVLATIKSTPLALLYIALFGVGSVGGMMLMSTVIGLPFIITAAHSILLQRVVRTAAGLASIGFGLFLGWQIGFVKGLFL